MQIFKTSFLFFLHCCLLTTINYAQTTTLSEFSVTAQYNNSSVIPTVEVVLRGNNLDIRGSYSSPEAFRICSPCRRNDNLQFPHSFLAINVSASGYINGVYYPQLYLGNGFSLEQEQVAQIPLGWSKIVRVSAPVRATGSIGFWQNSREVGQIDRALFYQANISLKGKVDVAFSSSTTDYYGRLYFDRLLIYRFAP